MKIWCLYVLVVCLSVDIDVAQGCDFYCCAGNRTAFVEAGWQNCCSEAQCLEASYNPPYASIKFMMIRREHYEPQPCNVQCCRRKFMDAHCCPDKICRAVDTMSSRVQDEFYNTDVAQDRYPSRNRVTQSWISFSEQPTTIDALEEVRRQQEEERIAEEEKQENYDSTMHVIVMIIVSVLASVAGLALRRFCLRHVCTSYGRPAPVPETVPLNAGNRHSSAVPSTALPIAPDVELVDEIPAQPGKLADHPPTYDEVTGHSPNHTVRVGPQKR